MAGDCGSDLALSLPALVDDMKDTAARAFDAMPDRLFIVGSDGRIAYRGGRGPRGFDVDEMEQALQGILAGR